MNENAANQNQNSEHPSTYFAPAERADQAIVRELNKNVENEPLFQAVLDSIDGYLMILNPERQVLAANKEFLKAFNITDPTCVLGERPGEVLQCIHAAKGPGGCGTSKFCSTCGAVISILDSQKKEQSITNECLATVKIGNTTESLELRVRATPVKVGKNNFTVLVFNDISGDKRREALERTFFHDVMNTVAGLMGWSSLMQSISDLDPKEAADRIFILSKRLQQEIEDQRKMLQAERGTLELFTQPVPIKGMFETLKAVFSAHPAAEEKTVEFQEFDSNAQVITDPSLLVRVLMNMIKNALEAVNPGETVRVSHEKTEEGIKFLVHNPGEIPPEVALRIFQRSFSTKAKAGRGIGTYSMKLFGERYLKGKVAFETSGEKGTIFSILIPNESENK